MQTLSTHKCFGGTLSYHKHAARSTQCDMRFTVFLPPGCDAQNKRPALVFLSGLTCSEDNFTIKAGAYRAAAALGLAIVVPDTSPRGEGVPTAGGGDVGWGAGFYVNATQQPWSTHYQMETYVTGELHELMAMHLPIDVERVGLFGHSMGGHGALTLFQKHPGRYKSLSAFAPICAPSQSVWGQPAFAQYLGTNIEDWKEHDACELLRKNGPVPVPILIDQGTSDPFKARLHTELFEQAAAEVGQQLTVRRHEGYDHGYFFISTFVEDHMRHHLAHL